MFQNPLKIQKYYVSLMIAFDRFTERQVSKQRDVAIDSYALTQEALKNELKQNQLLLLKSLSSHEKVK